MSVGNARNSTETSIDTSSTGNTSTPRPSQARRGATLESGAGRTASTFVIHRFLSLTRTTYA